MYPLHVMHALYVLYVMYVIHVGNVCNSLRECNVCYAMRWYGMVWYGYGLYVGDKKRCSSAKRKTTSTTLKVAMACRQLSDSTNSIERRASGKLKPRHQQLTACCHDVFKAPWVSHRTLDFSSCRLGMKTSKKHKNKTSTSQGKHWSAIATLHLTAPHLTSPLKHY